MFNNLRPRQKEILDILEEQTGPVTQTLLQKRMGYSREHGPIRHLARLEAMGYIAPRQKCEKRAIQLSQAGRIALAAKKAA